MSAFGGRSQPVDATLYLKGEMECAVMGQRFHRGFTAAEKAELWDGWKRGESLKAIGRAFGKPSSSIYFLVAPHGGIRPAQRRRSRLALTLAGRVVAHLRLDWSPEQIAGWLKRTHPEDECNQVSHETIYRSLFVQTRGVL